MDLEDAKRFCQIGIQRRYFGMREVREAIAVLKERLKTDRGLTIERILIERKALDASRALEILRELGGAVHPSDRTGPDRGMVLDAEALSESMEMFAISEESDTASEIEVVDEGIPAPAPAPPAPAPASVRPPDQKERVVPSEPRPPLAPETPVPSAGRPIPRAALRGGELLSPEDLSRALAFSLDRRNFLPTLGAFVAIAVVGSLLHALGATSAARTGTTLWYWTGWALASLFALVAFLSTASVIARSTHLALDGKPSLDFASAKLYLTANWFALVASPALFLAAVGLATLLAVGLVFLLGMIPYAGPVLFGVLTLVVFGLVFFGSVVAFFGILIFPAAVAAAATTPIETAKDVWSRVRGQPVGLAVTEVLAILFITVVSFALGSVVALPLSVTNRLAAEVLETPPVEFLLAAPGWTSATGSGEATQLTDGAEAERGAFEEFLFGAGRWLYVASMAVVLAAILTVPFTFMVILQVFVYRRLGTPTA